MGDTLLLPTNPSDAERRQVSIIFCDLADSTKISTHIDPEDLQDILRIYRNICATCIEKADGFVAKYQGDGVLAYVGYPRAHEDDAERAVRIALAIVDSVSQLRLGIEVRVRIGIATGSVIIGELIGTGIAQERDVVGETPNLASRVQGLAAPNTVAIADNTRRLIDDLFQLEDLGPQAVKGFPQPIRVWRVLGENIPESRFAASRAGSGRTALVGRDEELALLKKRWEQAKAGEGRVILLSAEAGLGKSRLAEALREQITSEPHIELRLQCSRHLEGSPLHPVVQYLQRAANLRSSDSADQKLDKLKELLTPAITADADAVSLIAELLAVPAGDRYPVPAMQPEERKRRTLVVLVALVVGQVASVPALLIVEDAQWADPTTRELLDHLVEQTAGIRLLAIITFRPDLEAPWPRQGHLISLLLDRLTRADTIELAERVAGRPLPSEVLDQIILTKSDGIPLAIEELTKWVLESDLVHEEDGRLVLNGPIGAVSIPATLKASMMERLDRAPAAARELGQAAACLGREFSLRILAASIAWDDDRLKTALQQLAGADVIFARNASQDGSYFFKHALVQDAAYESLPKRRRQELHSRIAGILLDVFSDISESQPELIAHHHTEAGQIKPAIDWWLRAGELAANRSANREVIGHMHRALRQFRLLPASEEPSELEKRAQLELTLQTVLGRALMTAKGYASADTLQAFDRARELCELLGDEQRLYPILYLVWLHEATRANHETCKTLADEVLTRAQKVRGNEPNFVANKVAACTQFFMGAPAKAHIHFDRAITLYEASAEPPGSAHDYGYELGAGIYAYGAWNLWLLGFLDEALSLGDKSLGVIENVNHSYTTARGFIWNAALHALSRNWQLVRLRSEAAIQTAREKGYPMVVAVGRVLHGAALSVLADPARAVDQMTEGLDAYAATGTKFQRPFLLTLLADTLLRSEQFPAGLRAVDDALDLMKASRERNFLSEAYRLQGDLRQGQGDASAAHASYQQALDVAHEQEARLLELRAATSLVMSSCEPDQAQSRDRLASVYAWFTQGFDTPDLRKARAVLARSSGE